MSTDSIVVVGASAGGLRPLLQFVQGLPADFGAPVAIVRHFPPNAVSELHSILARATSLAVVQATRNTPMQRGTIYVSSPGYHLIVEKGWLRLRSGPRLNTFRPSIDALFRSAALAYGSRTAGVILSGALDDGTVGLLTIHRVGGLTITQDPAEAEFSDMPLNVLKHFQADHVLPVSQIPDVLNTFVNKNSSGGRSVTDAIDNITKKAEEDLTSQQQDQRRGTLSIFSCPECGGVLWQADEDGPPIFRCHVGHMYGSEQLMAEQLEVVERSIYYTMRSLKEVMLLSQQLANFSRREQREDAAEMFEQRSRRAERQLAELENALLETPSPADDSSHGDNGHSARRLKQG